jgi:hypothetical protein
MSSPAILLREYLIGTGVITDADTVPQGAWPSYKGGIPDGEGVPHNAVALRDSRGMTEGKLQRSGNTMDTPGIQISVRALGDYNVAASKCNLIKWWTNRVNRYVITYLGFDYTLSSCKFSSPIYLGEEKQTNRVRHLFVINGLVKVIQGRV